MIACGDIIIFPGSYGDVYMDFSGLNSMNSNDGFGIPASVRKFECSTSGASDVYCLDNGIHPALKCKNRSPSGSECGDGGIQ